MGGCRSVSGGRGAGGGAQAPRGRRVRRRQDARVEQDWFAVHNPPARRKLSPDLQGDDGPGWRAGAAWTPGKGHARRSAKLNGAGQKKPVET